MVSMARMVSLLLLGLLATAALTDAQSHYNYAQYSSSCSQCDGGRTTLESRSCETGYSGCKCDIPICSPACTGEQVCMSPNKCGCLRSGSGGNTNCPYVQCSLGEKLDCYPGTCDESGSNCRCPTQYGFTGKNCLSITTTPVIKKCMVEVHNSSTQKTLLQNVNCAASGYINSVFWINAASLGDIRANWDAWYDDRPTLPGNPPVTYINPAPVTIGITKASVLITHLETGLNYSENCDGAREGINPLTAVTCDINRDWQAIGFPRLALHNQNFRVTVSAQLGGQKRVNLDGTQPQQFIGTPITRSAAFRFDLIPPVHCLTNNAASDCPYFAIYLDQDIRTNAKIEPRFYNWTDDGSGIAKFNVKIFKMSSVNGQLVNSVDPISQQDVDPIKNDCLFILNTESGVYSIELTVYDQAGNTAKARKLFIYNKDSNLRIDPGNPVYLKEANPSTNYTWLTSFENPKDGSNIPLTVTWKNHFISTAEFSGVWGYPAKPWLSSDGIDDRYGTRYGRRSIEAIQTLQNGIASYAVAYFLDPSDGGRGRSPPSWVILSSGNNSYQLPISQSLSDGNTIVVWLQATDAAFGTITEKLVIGVDRTVPEVKQESFQLKTGIEKTSTTLLINVADRESGIASISYRIFASGLSLPLTVAQPKTRNQTVNRAKREISQELNTPCNANDTTCYCIPQGPCFDYIQTIDIINCDIDRYAGQYFKVQYTIQSLSGASSIEQTIDLGFLSSNDIPCRPPIVLSPGAIAGIFFGVLLGIILLIVLIIVLVLLCRIYYFKKPVPRRIDNIRQTIRNRNAKSYEDENPAYETGGAFTGMVNKLSVKFKRASTKGKDVDDDDYIYTGSEAVRNNSTHIQRKNLQMDETISTEGRFAVIKKAFLLDGNERKVVAVKALRSGFSAADVRLMEEKIQFLSGVPRHANLVNFLGASEEENNGGPIMILEHCSMSLKDWLKSNRKVTSEVLESMLTFTLNIARGVEHLHANDIIHRRLAVRNVLLTQQFGGWVAKLIGFGPNRDDSDDKAKKVAVPVKWLSPETLSTINDIDPTYNQKTDGWSFGITIWEIYSLGETPYPHKNSNEAKRLIIKGLKPNKPDECPPELFESAIQPCWETSPGNRPTMTKVCSAIEAFRSGSGDGGQGYYATDDDENYRSEAYGGSRGGGDGGGGELYDDGR